MAYVYIGNIVLVEVPRMCQDWKLGWYVNYYFRLILNLRIMFMFENNLRMWIGYNQKQIKYYLYPNFNLTKEK